MAEQYGTRELDFDRPPLREVWQTPNEAPGDGESEDDDAAVNDSVEEPGTAYGKLDVPARTLILHGPPGTGKTCRLQQMFDKYTDHPADLDRNDWELQLVSRFGWRVVSAEA